MARIRSNNVFGTLTDNPLSNVATTMNSAGLANLAAVSGSDEAIITLDPNRVNGAPEIVRVTAHTGSATSATIDRGEFGTSAREHPAGTEWVHGPVAATSSDLDGDFGGIWEDYTPTNSNITVGNGTQIARFTRVGNTVTVQWGLLFGSGTSFGGSIAVGLPVASRAGVMTHAQQIGAAYALDSGTAEFDGSARRNNSDTSVRVIVGDSVVGTTSPFTWATGDQIGFTLTYEAA